MESQLTPIGKLFFGGILAWISKGAELHFKAKGTPEQVQALTNAAFTTKRFYLELNSPTATIESLMNKLNEKNNAIQQFKDTTGLEWPL